MNIETVGLDLCMPCQSPAQNEVCYEFCLYCSGLYPVCSGKPARIGAAPPLRAICSAP